MNSPPENVSDRPMIRYDKAHKVKETSKTCTTSQTIIYPEGFTMLECDALAVIDDQSIS
jgi:hypothetical protein